MNACQPSRSSRMMFVAAAVVLRGQVHHREQQRAHPVGRPVEQERVARADRRHERSADGRSEREGGVARDRHEAVRLLEQPLGDRLRNEPRRRRRVERDRGAADRLERDQLPDLRVPADEQGAHRDPDAEVGRVGADHHQAPRHAVGDDAADEQRRDLRQRPGGEGEARPRSRSRRGRAPRTRPRSARGSSRRTRSSGPRRGSGSSALAGRSRGNHRKTYISNRPRTGGRDEHHGHRQGKRRRRARAAAGRTPATR